MEFRKVFDLIPDEFDRWRPQYCPEAFADMVCRFKTKQKYLKSVQEQDRLQTAAYDWLRLCWN